MPTLTRRPSSPARADARRLQRPRWTHPRAVAGAALVAGSMLLGSLLVTNVARTTEVWAVSDDVRAGEPVRPADLERVDVRLTGAAATAYLAEPDPTALASRVAEATWAHDLAAGELVPVAALAAASDASGVEVPLQVTGTAMPADLAAGHRVDVWVAPEPGTARGGTASARRVLQDVGVVAVHGDSSAFGESGVRSVVVLVDDARAGVLPDALAALADGRTTLVRRSGAA
ncbi:hypothetical protein FE697_015100 [Mumia zhuanghuii]|uniref:SAF domain-containing protein n=2 Tax=Mumia TaxID=1546255 RepID=A0ABW1QSF3_9ACTN|nr:MULTISPECIES: hypothetical protein [Mumia]KAA1422467.1 hypothetical protein FE697_015100 [Mumia zhuanghuii]